MTILYIIIFVLISYLIYNNITKYREGMSISYTDCINNGYTKEFCSTNPMNPSSCLCENGTLGQRLPGYGGECVCTNNLPIAVPPTNHNQNNFNSQNKTNYLLWPVENAHSFFTMI